jgi:hypothetical protein
LFIRAEGGEARDKIIGDGCRVAGGLQPIVDRMSERNRRKGTLCFGNLKIAYVTRVKFESKNELENPEAFEPNKVAMPT